MIIEQINLENRPRIVINGKTRVLLKTFNGKDPRETIETMIRVYRKTTSCAAVELATGIKSETANRILSDMGVKGLRRGFNERRNEMPVFEPHKVTPGTFITCYCGCHRVRTGKRGAFDAAGNWWAPTCIVQMREARK